MSAWLWLVSANAFPSKPAILLADEPTVPLGTHTTAEIITALKRVNRELGPTNIIVQHDLWLSKQVDRMLTISDGKSANSKGKLIKSQNHEQRQTDS